MSAIGHEPPPFFNRGPAPLLRLLFFLAAAIILMVADLRFHTLEWARLTIVTLVWPVQRMAWLPIQAAGNIGHYFIRQSDLQADNDSLRRQRIQSANLLLRQRYLEDENRRLRALLDMKMRQPVNGQVAEIIYATRDPFSRHVIIDKGLQQGIQPGQVVVDERGVVGQIIRSFAWTAEVSLLTDKQHAIPVQVQRNSLRSVLFGAGNGHLELRFLSTDTDVQVGDILVTSGLDGIYLAGLPVAKVIKISRDSNYAFAHIVCDPVAGVERHGLVLVLDPRTSLALPPPADQSAGKYKLGRKEKR
jgi:rod shape-determining protein MreC